MTTKEYTAEEREHKRKYYLEHREEIRARRRRPETLIRERERYRENGDKIREYHRRWDRTHYAECRERHILSVQKWAVEHPRERRGARLRREYGMSPSAYKTLLVSQDGVCLLCGLHPGGENLVVDHDHDTGVVRGLLCQACNTAFGGYEKLLKLVGEVGLMEHLRRGKVWTTLSD